MYQLVAGALFQSRTRVALLDILFCQRLGATVSELARRAGVSPRSASMEVRNLLGAGLVTVEGVGGANLVRANLNHPAAPHIEGLLAAPRLEGAGEERLRQTLAAFGAPLAAAGRREHLTLEDALLSGLEASRNDGTILRVLPVVLARNLGQLNWPSLKEGARRRKLKAELGMLVELTADLLGKPELRAEARDLLDRRRRVRQFLPEARSDYERRLAKERAPRAARRWGFLMNLTEASFRSTLERHGAA